ncbi:hypothetical protein [Hymenobacter weizhouensis]|uniref:hypothetical protein n=1 Tax=Hymenobacter sp. YIM 151500-1 TaxID=2987689 RepID=UPI0022280064|nr:hypothetical protein [Hymenobacter sp. YIM 151500-1]UYZ62915.1 hypothetical protein OIS53_18220 [Hymenobacter sp. YIM 151500-1]
MQNMSFFRALGGKVVLLGLLLSAPLPAAPLAPPSQIQVARQFLLAVLRGDWPVAYATLAPEVRARMSARQFREAARPLEAGQQTYGPAIDLYKFGYRLREGEQPEPFVAFTFKADTLQKQPHLQLDITFRDSTARQVQGFRVVK